MAMRFWKRLTCPYDNPDGPREFVFVSNTNDRLGVTWNAGAPFGFYMRASRKLCATPLAFGSVWCVLAYAVLWRATAYR